MADVNLTDLANHIVGEHPEIGSASKARQIIRDLFGSIFETVADGSSVGIGGVGTFACRKTPARPRRQGRNPATGETMWFKAKPAGKKLSFRPAKVIKDLF